MWLAGDHLELTGPCGAAPWRIELGATDHPVDVVTRIVRDTLGEPMLVHSTSWRREADAVVLSFVVVIDEALVGDMESLSIGRTELARGEATAAPGRSRPRRWSSTASGTWPGWRRTTRSSRPSCRLRGGRPRDVHAGAVPEPGLGGRGDER